MRLIDADNAIHALGVFSDMEHGNKHFLNGINSAKEIINECATIDAVPVVRGYSYEDDKTYSGPGISNYICSVCGEMQGTWKKGLAQNQKFKFCPWCGAKMEDKPCG